MKPPWAAHIWVDVDHIYLEMPSPVAGAKATTAKFVRDEVGLAQALRVLSHRAQDFREATIGTHGAPTQRQVDLGRFKVPSKPRPSSATNPQLRSMASQLLRRLGIV